MLEEEKAWFSDLSWDYSQIRGILISFAKQKLLPGYVAIGGNRAVGYTYFLVNQAKGIIGSLYASPGDGAQEAVENLVSLAISSLKDTRNITRVEAQIMPFHHLDLTGPFTRQGFSIYPRCYLELDLGACPDAEVPFTGKIIPWTSLYLDGAAEMNMLSYQNQTDAEICESYLRSLVENPGCGTLLPEASFMALDAQGSTSGIILSSRISDGAAMIPQIAVHPLHQGRGLGNSLMRRALSRLKALEFSTVGLTVTKENRRAYDWYHRLGFKPRKDFGAYVWQR
jgi:ribosomal protein S18 acetylase RimI-like enzyme